MKAGFLPGGQGPLFYVIHEPADGPVRGCVLYVHPFAEELNKSRRMAARQARLLADQGYVVLMPDLHGCGDSGGDFGGARWGGWLDDLERSLDWLQARYPGPVALWGLRVGCLLISEFLTCRSVSPAALLYWQPVTHGERFLTQFLRLRMAAAMMGDGKETTAQLRARLDGGETLEVAGYALAPELAEGLAGAELAPPGAATLCWLEVAQGESPALLPASTRLIDGWRQQGARVHAAAVAGDPFWTTQEIHEAPALLEASLRCLQEVNA